MDGETPTPSLIVDQLARFAPQVEPLRTPRVAIIGTTPHREQAPYDDESWEIWAQSMPTIKRWDRWFEIHNADIIKTQHGALWNWLAAKEQVPGFSPIPDGKKPVYMRAAHPEIAGSVAYPKHEIVARYGTWFLTSTAAFEVALALALGATDIALFGIDMANSTEYKEQKPGVRHFITLAKERGVRVFVPVECELLAPARMYGIEDDGTAVLRTAKRAELEKRKAEIQQIQQQMRDEFCMLDGAIKMMDHMEQNWV